MAVADDTADSASSALQRSTSVRARATRHADAVPAGSESQTRVRAAAGAIPVVSDRVSGSDHAVPRAAAAVRAQSGSKALAAAVPVVPVHAAAVEADSTTAADDSGAAAMAPGVGALTVFPSAAGAVVATAPAGPLAVLNAGITAVFDSAASWLSGFPANPVSDFLQGALLLVRRSLFNQAPTVASTQFATLPSGVIVGQIEVTDPEGDPVSFAVTTDPGFGTVAVDSTGFWTYTPGAGYQGRDSFTVTVQNITGGLNLLNPSNPFGAATAEVAVSSTVGSGLVTARYTRGYTVMNASTRTIKYLGSVQTDCWNCSQDGSPLELEPYVGQQIKPGESFHFEQIFKSFQSNDVQLKFEAVNDPFGVSAGSSATFGKWAQAVYVSPVKALTFGPASSTAGSFADGGDTTVLLTDPVGTEVTVSADPNSRYYMPGAAQKMAVALSQMCKKSAGAKCSFNPPNGQSMFEAKDVREGFTQPAIRAIFRNGAGEFSFTKEVGKTVTESSTIGISAEASADVFGIVSASVSSNYEYSYESSTTYSESITKAVPENTTLIISQQYPIASITGDFEIRMGRSVLKLLGVTFDVPDTADGNRGILTAYDTYANGDPAIPTVPGIPVDTPSTKSQPIYT